MVDYEYGRIEKLAACLAEASLPSDVIGQIMAGGENVRKSTSPALKAAWMREAMLRMDQLLDLDTRYAVREACACCLGGKRLQLSKEIFKSNHSLEERIHAANQTRMVFGHSVTLQEDGKILVRFFSENLPSYRCVCLPKAEQPLSITYCYCCGGHVKHHLQTALGQALSVEVCSSALSSGGKQGCEFLLTLV